jgi:DNA-binding transcriptional regulator YiaG
MFSLESACIVLGTMTAQTKTTTGSVEKLIDARIATRTGGARKLREQAGLSQEEIADAIGVTRACVSRWEAGARRPTGDAAQRYAQLLDLLARRAREGIA